MFISQNGFSTILLNGSEFQTARFQICKNLIPSKSDFCVSERSDSRRELFPSSDVCSFFRCSFGCCTAGTANQFWFISSGWCLSSIVYNFSRSIVWPRRNEIQNMIRILIHKMSSKLMPWLIFMFHLRYSSYSLFVILRYSLFFIIPSMKYDRICSMDAVAVT